jgi:hypothetical protein
MNKVTFSCVVNTNIPVNPITLQILLDDAAMFNKPITAEETVSFEFDEGDGEHTLRFLISDKNDTHVLRDNNGNVLDSTELSITDIKFDEIDITNIIMVSPLEYRHNYNGNGEETVDKFYDIAGCNGEITLNFTTPIYLWMLENM